MSDFVVNKENLLKGGWYIEIANEKHCEQVQLALFELEVFWRDGDVVVAETNKKFIGFDADDEGFRCTNNEEYTMQSRNITNEFNAHMKEKQLAKNVNKKPHEMLTPYCRVQWLDGSTGVYLGKIPNSDQYLFAWEHGGNIYNGQFSEDYLSSEDESWAISHIYARPFNSFNDVKENDLIDPSKRGEFVWQRDMVSPMEKQLKQKLAELSEQMKEAQKQLAELHESMKMNSANLDEYIASKQ